MDCSPVGYKGVRSAWASALSQSPPSPSRFGSWRPHICAGGSRGCSHPDCDVAMSAERRQWRSSLPSDVPRPDFATIETDSKVGVNMEDREAEESDYEESGGGRGIADGCFIAPGIQVLGGASANGEDSEDEEEEEAHVGNDRGIKIEETQLDTLQSKKEEEDDNEDDIPEDESRLHGNGDDAEEADEEDELDEEAEEKVEQFTKDEQDEEEDEEEEEVERLAEAPVDKERSKPSQAFEAPTVSADLDMADAEREEEITQATIEQTQGAMDEEVDEDVDDAEEAEAEEADPEEADEEMELEENVDARRPLEPHDEQHHAAVQHAETQSSMVWEESSQLVAVPEAEAEAEANQLVANPGHIDSWAELPPEVNGQWTISSEICSLNVAGQVMKLPRSVYERLYAYQRQGVAWMWNLFHKTFGAILADEMGLGKTVQVAAFLACLKFTQQGSRFLVVAPVTLLEQWKRELQTWAGDTGLSVFILHGTSQERRAAQRGLYAKGGVLLTSYDIVRTSFQHLRFANARQASALLPKKRKRPKRGVKDDDSPSEEELEVPAAAAEDEGADIPWDVVIIDEAHALKNPSCVIGKALRRISSKSRFLLTGTPLQNKLIDMWALMDLAQPSLLGNHATFERNFSDRIARGSRKNATKGEVELKDQLARNLKQLTAPHFLRRVKSEVTMTVASTTSKDASCDAPAPCELPPKSDIVLWLSLTEAQNELYDLYLGSETVRRAGEGKCGMEALRAITCLKKLCNHPLLMLPPVELEQWFSRLVPSRQRPPGANEAAGDSASSTAPAPRASAGSQIDDSLPAPESQHVLPRLRALVPNSLEGAALLSCKLRVLSVLLPQLQRRGRRCLIFSHQRGMLDLIQHCVLRVLGLKYLRIDGALPPKDRDIKVGKFQQPDSRYFCMCVSMQVGGVGLTITGADRVILCDPGWNPAMDSQAIDRVHRIGQQQEVVVYRLIGAGAIEDKMFRLQVFKRGLAKTALEHEQQLRFFTQRELKALFEAPGQSSSTQQLMAEKLGTEALEHEELLKVVAKDIGDISDPQAAAFWQTTDVMGMSDYEKLFQYLEQAQQADEEDIQEKARVLTENLRSEEYKKGQVLDGNFRRYDMKENMSPQAIRGAGADLPVLQDR